VVRRVSLGGRGVETVALAGPYPTACWPPLVDRHHNFVYAVFYVAQSCYPRYFKTTTVILIKDVVNYTN
jgi:hypothetical protein